MNQLKFTPWVAPKEPGGNFLYKQQLYPIRPSHRLGILTADSDCQNTIDAAGDLLIASMLYNADGEIC